MAVIALGAVVLPIGLAVGGLRLAKSGASATAVLGVVAGLLALVVLARGVRSTGRGWSRVRRIVAVSASVVVTLLCAATLTPAIYATHTPPTEGVPPLSASLGAGARVVRFGTADGVALSGWYVRLRNRAAVVAL